LRASPYEKRKSSVFRPGKKKKAIRLRAISGVEQVWQKKRKGGKKGIPARSDGRLHKEGKSACSWGREREDKLLLLLKNQNGGKWKGKWSSFG